LPLFSGTHARSEKCQRIHAPPPNLDVDVFRIDDCLHWIPDQQAYVTAANPFDVPKRPDAGSASSAGSDVLAIDPMVNKE
jgi:hypothetical protein